MENTEKYLYTFSTFDWKIVKCLIIKETRYTWQIASGAKFSKDCVCDWRSGCEHVNYWSLDLEELKSWKKERIEHKIKMLKKDIEHYESILAQSDDVK